MAEEKWDDGKKVVVDTNLLLDDSKILFKLSKLYDKIIIPLAVLKELDKHKFKNETSFSARQAIRALIEFKNNFSDKIIFDIGNINIDIDDGNDAKIIKCAKENDAVLSTKDMSMSIISEAQKIKTKLYDVVLNNLFNPYLFIEQDILFEHNKDSVFDYGIIIEGENYDKVLNLFKKAGKREDLTSDCWFFVIITANKSNPIIYANNPMKNIFQRIDNNPNYREISIDKNVCVKSKDLYQVCAIYSMIEAPNTLICGTYGSGKSLLATAYSLVHNDKKTFISRPNLTVDRRFELGYLPGTLQEKLLPWMAGILSGLYHMFSNTKGQTTNKIEGTNDYDYVKEHIFKKHFEMTPMETIQGMSFMSGDLLILDEVQLCSISILSTVLSRFGKGSKLIMTGDVKQTYGVIQPSESGLIKLLRLMPNKYLAYVELKENYRSELLDLADKLQDKTLF